ncbi:MAG: hypothetical protein NWE93_10980 [Candidatus Bathyarchaeota archaeon]|nr:hypothetical protein [Candidatus Bathyarchaeota archaeon]
MSVNEYHLQTLVQLGLTPNQAKLYLSLLNIGKTSGAILSKQTGLVRQEIYRLLNELYDIGLVEKFISTPTEFQAIDIQDCITHLMMMKACELEKTKERTQSLIDEYSGIRTPISTLMTEYKFLLIPQKQLVHETRERMFGNAKQTVRLTSTNKRFSQGITHFFEVWEAMLKRNVDVQVIVVGDRSKFCNIKRLELVEQYQNFHLKFTCQNLAGILIVDGAEAIVTLQPQVDLGASPVFWTNHPEFLTIYNQYFLKAWEQACKIASSC